jgi:hypothetical protein
VIAVARLNVSDAKSRVLEEFLTEHIFTMKSDDYRRSDMMYHRTHTGEARQIRQTSTPSPEKEVNMGEMLEDMKRRGVIQSLVILRRSRPEDEGSALLCRLQENEHHKERTFSTATD